MTIILPQHHFPTEETDERNQCHGEDGDSILPTVDAHESCAASADPTATGRHTEIIREPSLCSSSLSENSIDSEMIDDYRRNDGSVYDETLSALHFEIPGSVYNETIAALGYEMTLEDQRFDNVDLVPEKQEPANENSNLSESPQYDYYPRLTLTLSDDIDFNLRKRCPSSCPEKFLKTSCSSMPTTPIRKQISLSLSIPPTSPLPVARNLVRTALQKQNVKLQNQIKNFQARRKEKMERRRSRIIVIKANHKLKLVWDTLSFILTIASAFKFHTQIRDRSTYEYDAFTIFSNIWFLIDFLLNFITEHRRSDGTVMKTGREVWGRYLTTWFAIDALSLLPWERMFIRPIILMQKRRNIFSKFAFRSKAVLKVTKFLGKRKYYFKYFGKVTKKTKKVGYGGKKLLHLIIKYLPKYLLFYRNMRSIMVIRILRFLNYMRKIATHLRVHRVQKKSVDNYNDECSITEEDSVMSNFDSSFDGFDEADLFHSVSMDDHHSVRKLHESMDDSHHTTCKILFPSDFLDTDRTSNFDIPNINEDAESEENNVNEVMFSPDERLVPLHQ